MKSIILNFILITLFFSISFVTNASWPNSCKEVLKDNPSALDGEHTLYLNNNPQKRWKAYCHDMQGVPKEYLTLQKTCEGLNYSSYAVGGGKKGSTVVTKFMKVRINPNSLELIRGDLTFATSWGKLIWPKGIMTSRPYAFAADCAGSNSSTGRANIDLRGTLFKIDTSHEEQFIVSGSGAAGNIIYSHNDQVVYLTGGGFCGSTQPGPWWEPQNLRLEYIGL